MRLIKTMLFISVEIRPRGFKTFSCSTQPSMNIFLLINIKMPTIVGILTFMRGENSILDLSEPKKADFLCFYTYEHLKISCSTVEHEKSFLISGPGYR